MLRAARRALREEMPRRVAVVEAAPDTAFACADAPLTWDGAAMARLRAGRALRPQVEVLDSEFLDGPQRERVRPAAAFVDDRIATTWRRCSPPPRRRRRPGLRGPLHRLSEALGVVAGRQATRCPALRGRLKALGVGAGRFALFMPALLKPRAAAMRARLWGAVARRGRARCRRRRSRCVPADWPAGFANAMGWVDAGPVLLRLDVAERVAAELA